MYANLNGIPVQSQADLSDTRGTNAAWYLVDRQSLRAKSAQCVREGRVPALLRQRPSNKEGLPVIDGQHLN